MTAGHGAAADDAVLEAVQRWAWYARAGVRSAVRAQRRAEEEVRGLDRRPSRSLHDGPGPVSWCDETARLAGAVAAEARRLDTVLATVARPVAALRAEVDATAARGRAHRSDARVRAVAEADAAVAEVERLVRAAGSRLAAAHVAARHGEHEVARVRRDAAAADDLGPAVLLLGRGRDQLAAALAAHDDARTLVARAVAELADRLESAGGRPA